MAKSNIVVDDQGISRTLFGWTWQTMRWDNVRFIRVVPTYDPALRKKVRTISLYPRTKPKVRLLPWTAMWFTDQAIDAGRLIAMINHYTALHRIKIESIDSGEKVSVISI